MPEDFNLHSATNGNMTSKSLNETINGELRDALFTIKNIQLSNVNSVEIIQPLFLTNLINRQNLFYGFVDCEFSSTH